MNEQMRFIYCFLIYIVVSMFTFGAGVGVGVRGIWNWRTLAVNILAGFLFVIGYTIAHG